MQARREQNEFEILLPFIRYSFLSLFFIKPHIRVFHAHISSFFIKDGCILTNVNKAKNRLTHSIILHHFVFTKNNPVLKGLMWRKYHLGTQLVPCRLHVESEQRTSSLPECLFHRFFTISLRVARRRWPIQLQDVGQQSLRHEHVLRRNTRKCCLANISMRCG